MDRQYMALMLFVLVTAALFSRCLGVQESDRAVGDDFFVLFMDNHDSSSSGSPSALKLYVTAADKYTSFTVTIQSYIGYSNTRSAQPGEVLQFNIPGAAMIDGNTLSRQGLHVTASVDVAVYGVSALTNSADGFLALPTSKLGNEYYTVSQPSGVTQLAFGAVFEDTRVEVDFPSGVSVMYDGQLYTSVNPLILAAMERFETVQIQCLAPCDLTGTYIKAYKPIAVFSGNKMTTGSQMQAGDHLISQLLPLYTWGKTYAILGSPDHSIGDLVHIMASEDSTTVTRQYSSSNRPGAPIVLDKGETHILNLLPGFLMHVVADKPIQVTHLTKSHIDSTAVDPTMITIPSIEQYSSSYRFTTPAAPGSDYKHYLLLIMSRSQTQYLEITAPDGSILPSPSWLAVSDFFPVRGAVVTIPHGTYSINAVDDNGISVPVGAVLYGTDLNNSYGFPAGLQLAAINPCVITNENTGDMIDNDCDKYIDEEECNGIDDDLDGRLDEDCHNLPDWATNNRNNENNPTIKAVGHEFMVMFLENDGSIIQGAPDPPNELFVTSADNSALTVRVQSPGLGIDFRRSVPGNAVSLINISADARMEGSVRGNKGIMLTAEDNDATVFGVNKDFFSVDGFLALPCDVLGIEYYTVSYRQPQFAAELGIAAVYDNTSVKVQFLGVTSSNLQVTFEGSTYTQGDMLSLTMDKFNTVQLQCRDLCDLTGTYISSDKPVAVFSGNVRASIPTSRTSRDHLVEQMIPVQTWGSEFPVMSSPKDDDGDLVLVLAQEDDTVVTMNRFNEPASSRTLDRGANIDWEIPSNQLAYVTATKPVLLVQFLKSQKPGDVPADPAMIVVPAADQFSVSYKFSTSASVSSTYTNYLMITIHDSDKMGLFVNGAPVSVLIQWKSLPITTYVGGVLSIPAGTHIISHTDPDATFGVILYGAGDRESYAMPIGMQLLPINPCLPTEQVVNDGIDNDCDNFIDEEICDGLDDDNDGRVDEDCETVVTLPPTIRPTQPPTVPTTTTTTTEPTTTTPSPPPPPQQQKDIYDVYHCEEDPLSIDCGESHNWIQIIQAHYGRVSYPGEKTCGVSNYQNLWEDKYLDRLCGYVNHYADVAGYCDRQNNCTLDPLLYKDRSGVNPCTSDSLYLHVTYRCVAAYEYQYNDLEFGADEASSELDNGLSSGWRKPSDCALFAYHSEGSCEAVCAIPLLQGSTLCPKHSERCLVENAEFTASNIKAWCPDDVDTDCAFLDSFLGETYRVEGVILSGGRRYLGWISKFTLYFSMDKENWELAPTDKVVSDGNTDSVNATVVHLVYPVIARWMRIKVIEYESFPYAHVAYIHHHAVERCPRLTLQNTNIQNVDGAYGDEILVQCTDPNTLVNYDTEYTTTCNQYLQWEPVKLCNTISCGPIPEETVPEVILPGQIFVAKVGGAYSCPTGNTSLGYELLSCNDQTQTWQWQGQCCDACLRSYDEIGIDDTCYRFPLSINAGITTDPVSRLALQQVDYVCIPGHELVSNSQDSECSQSGDDFLWDDNVIECSRGNFSSVVLTPDGTDIGAFLSTAVLVDGLEGPTYLVGAPGFETREATVACRQELGNFTATGLAMSIQLADVDSPDNVRRENTTCLGTEETILQCISDYTTTSTETSVAAFICHLPDGCVNGELRLLETNTSDHGLVQYCHQNTWGAVTGLQSGWHINEATVACKQLGYSAFISATFPDNYNTTITADNMGPGWLFDVHCTGAEAKLTDCTFGTIAEPNVIGAGFQLEDRGDLLNFRDELAYAECQP